MARPAVQLMLVLALSPAVVSDALYGYEDEAENMVSNWSMEDELAETEFALWNATYTRTTDYSHTGDYSMHVHPRAIERSGIENLVTITEPGYYYYSAFVLVRNNSTFTDFYNIKLYGNDQKLSELPFQQGTERWRQLGGDLHVKAKSTGKWRFAIVVTDPSLDYYLDSVSLIKIHEDPDWRAKANARIAQRHTTNVNIGLTIPEPIDPCFVEFKVHQTKRHFGLGSAVNSWRFLEDSVFGESYRRVFFENFEWSGFENSVKWRTMEPVENRQDYWRVDPVLDVLEAKNITMRGHCVIWDMEQNLPSWLLDYSPSEMIEKINSRIDSLMQRYRGRFVQWGVVNEYLRGHYFEELLGMPNLIDDIYRRVHAIDPDTSLVVNEPRAYRFAQHTSAVPNLHAELVERGLPNSGIGVQGHFKNVPVNPHVIKKRMDVICAAGAPVTVTELSVHHTDVAMRAQQLDEALVIAMAADCTNAIVLWGFSDQALATMHAYGNMSLFDGETFEPNEAGRVLMARRKEWTTPDHHIEAEAGRRETALNFVAFQGAFEIQVLFDGKVVQNDTFYVHPGTPHFTHSLTLDPAAFAGLQAGRPCPQESDEECDATEVCVDSEIQQANALRREMAWQRRSPQNYPL